MQAQSVNANANALRWGTSDIFRFDADAPPIPGDAVLGSWRPTANDRRRPDGCARRDAERELLRGRRSI